MSARKAPSFRISPLPPRNCIVCHNRMETHLLDDDGILRCRAKGCDCVRPLVVLNAESGLPEVA